MPRKQVTMQQIAERAGVSKFTVSRALSGLGGVSEETRRRVLEIALQLGYFSQPSRMKTAVRAGDATDGLPDNLTTVVVLMPCIRGQQTDSDYWGRIIDGIAYALRENNLGMVIVTEHSTDDFLRVMNSLDALGLIGVGEISTSMLVEIRRLGLPFVLVDHQDPLIPSDAVFINNFEGCWRLTNYLVAQGHRHFQFVGDMHWSRSFYDRWLGFRAALEENGIHLDQSPSLLTLPGTDSRSNAECIIEVLGSLRRQTAAPTALVCANDALALSALDAIDKLEIRVPDEMSVVGFDDIEEARTSTPPLTTIHVPKEYMGRRAVEMLLRRLRHPETATEKVFLSGDPVYRDSAGAIVAQSAGGRTITQRPLYREADR